jgi:RNA:NAD 2'-phosphotransferase (TPT1/KptA family)
MATGKTNTIFLKHTTVSVGNITLNANGYADVQSYAPSIQYAFAAIGTWQSVTPVAAFNITSDGRFLIGSANQTINGLTIVYFYN